MRPSPSRDLIVGIFVLVGLGAVAYLSLKVGGDVYGGPGGLEVVAGFNDIGGLKVRAPVVVSGVKVGRVTAIELDEVLRARVHLDLNRDLELDDETSASIRTAGLLGDQFIELMPGAGENLLVSGEEIAYTEDAFSIEKTLGKVLTNFGNEDEE